MNYDYTRWNTFFRKIDLQTFSWIKSNQLIHACRTRVLVIVLKDDLPNSKVYLKIDSVQLNALPSLSLILLRKKKLFNSKWNKKKVYAKTVNTKSFKFTYKNQYLSEVLMDLIEFLRNFLVLQNELFFVKCPFCTPCFEWLSLSCTLANFVLSYFVFIHGVMN